MWMILLLTTAVMATGGWMFTVRGRTDKDADVLTHVVTRGNYTLEVVEQGEVESASNVEVRCEVKSGTGNASGTVILEVVEEGTNVQPGDILCRLDSSSFETELVQQQIACNTSEAAMIEATNTWEAAIIAKLEYVEGTFFQEEQTIQSEIFLAEENLRRAKEYVNYSERLAARGYVTAQQLEGDRFAVEIAKTDLDAAKTKLRVLREYTKTKMLKQLDSDIKSSEAKKTSEESSYKLELSKLKEIEEQIENCTIRAPAAGQVVYANKQSSRSGSEFIVEAGAMVRENQVIVRLPDPDTMQVKTQINESRVTMVEPGMPAMIRLDAYDAQKLNGEVTRVSEYPEPSSFWSSQVKEYATFVKIVDSPIQIRPGLTAEVTIIADSQADVLLVPVQALHEHGPHFYCIVRNASGWEPREVKLISSNDKFAIVDGVDEGAVVAMNPRKLLDKVKLPEILEEEAPQGPRRSGGQGPGGQGPGGQEPGGQGPGGPRPGGAGGGRAADGPSRPDGLGRPGIRPPGAGEPNVGGPPGAGGPGGMDPAAIVSMIFGRLDKNKDGKISADEIPADQADRMSSSDANGDGFIERAELQKAMAERMSVGGGPPGDR
jgi:multidrug resistance efflux pump